MDNLKREKVLITGGTGLIGTHLTGLLVQKGYSVGILSRNPEKIKGAVVGYKWDLDEEYIDPEAFQDTKFIIHLAGADVAGKRWSSAYKKEIIRSRTESAQILFNWLSNNKHSVSAFLSSSGVNYYPQNTGKRFSEEDAYGNDFLAEVTKAWEKSADQISSLGIRTVKFRIGVVLSNKGGALVELARPVRFGAAAPFGNGNQIMSWIHIHDLSSIFIFALENEFVSGVFNAVAPHPVTNRAFVYAIAATLNKFAFLPAVPAFALKLVLGERAAIVLNGVNASSEKIEKSGFFFEYSKLDLALRALL